MAPSDTRLRSRSAMLFVEDDALDHAISSSDELESAKLMACGGSPASTAAPSTAASEDDRSGRWGIVRTRSAMAPPLMRQRTAMLIDEDCLAVDDMAVDGYSGQTRGSRQRRFRGWVSRVLKSN